jgi:CRISPR/Cas system CSM-associated protein Csm3 (group 7 of RAMP superfamily)
MVITLLIATIKVESGWAVGTVPLADPSIDRDILLDGHGRPWVPGSTIAGSLRAHLATAEPGTEIRLMGSPPAADDGAASPLWVVGCVFAPAGTGPELEITGQTAIDRRRTAAAAKALRFSRSSAGGGTLAVYLRHDPAPGDLPLSGSDLAVIASWQPAIGRGRTTGGGRAMLTSLRHGTIDPATPAGARKWLTYSGPGLFDAVATEAINGREPGGPWREYRLEIRDGLLVGDGQPGKVARTRQRLGRPIIPGTAWKGIIRSRAEFIIRSRYGERAACQQQTGCGECVICGVFGHQGQRGLLAFRDSVIDPAQPGPERTQVAIDRVTGGSRDELLFTTQPLTGGQLRLQIDKLGDMPPWVPTVIDHVLRDLDDGLIGVGSRVTRGLGTLRLLDPIDPPGPVTVPGLEPAAAPEPAI